MPWRALIAFLPILVIAQQPVPQKPPLIRSQVTLVPLDVRVLDRDGSPVTDLTADDFVVLEDGVPQVIRHFSMQTFTADPAAAPMAPQFRTSVDDAPRALNRRVFLIMLGRGRHQAASKYVDALATFVTRDLLPQDQVAVMAWNRATDFTNDHAQIAAIINRFRGRHEKIETQLAEWFSGLRAVYGSREIPAHIQKEIDGVFAEAAALRPRDLTPSPSSDIESRVRQTRKTADDLIHNEILKTFPDASFLPDMRSEITADLTGLSFDEYVAMAPGTFQDLGSLYAAIDYLRHLEGEKHMLFLTDNGVQLPLTEGNSHLASVASDARIAINIIQTGGMVGPGPARFVMTSSGSRLDMRNVPTPGMVYRQSFSVRDLRMIADVTGGQMMAYTRSAPAFDRLNRGIGFQYLLAYAPAKSATDGRFRKIEIKVRRPGLRVHHRGGYYASPRIVPLDRRDFVTFSRIRAAAMHDKPIAHIPVSVARTAPVSEGPRALDVQLTVDIARISLPVENGIRRGVVDVAVYCGDEKRAPVGESLSKIDLTLTEEAYQGALKTGATFTIRVPLSGTPRHVKAIVYDYGADLLGSAQVTLK
ncbi:MAG: VWA domain-containing protein [Vicinamibacterales bacterium]